MKKIKLAYNTIDNEDYKILINFLKKKNYLNQSKYTKIFEKKFSNFLKMKYSIFVNSGSSANLLIAQTLLEGGYLKNKIIILPSVSWPTTISPYLQLGYKILLCDCDKVNLGLDVNHLKKLCIKYNPSLVSVVNVLGHPNNFNEIKKLQKKYKFKIIEDNCESLGSKYNNFFLGSFGFASSHSFYYGHHISTIEGGMVSTNDLNFYNVALAIKAHGWSREMNNKFRLKLEKKYNVTNFSSLYKFYYSGFNIRSTDLNAVLGINQLKKIKEIGKIRFQNFKIYKSNLKNFWFQDSHPHFISSFGYVTLIKNREETYKFLLKNKIESRPVICGNMSRQPFIKNKFLNQNDKFTNSDVVDKYGIYLPNHKNLSFKEIIFICDCLKKISKPIFF